MTLLCVDASGKSAAVAVEEDGQILSDGFENSGFTHSETLLPLIDSTLQKAGRTIEDIDEFAVTNGPGSFTGLRIGAALVKGLAGERLCIPVPTLLALGYNAISETGVVIPMMDARCNQVYTAVFKAKDQTLHRLTEDRAIAVTELEEKIRFYLADGETVIVLGDGAYLLQEEIAKQVVFLPEEKRLIIGRSIALAARDCERVSATALGLRYLRLSQAEREKNMKIGGSKL